MSTSISSGAAVYISNATHPLFSVIKMMINIKSMFVMFRSHVHMSDVLNLLLVFFIYNNVRSRQNPTAAADGTTKCIHVARMLTSFSNSLFFLFLSGPYYTQR